MSKQLYTIILFLPMIFLFLPAFGFWLPGLNATYLFFYMFLFISIITIFIYDKKHLFLSIYKIIKNTPFKYFILTIILMSLNLLLLSIIGITTVSSAVRAFLLQIVLCLLPIFLYLLYFLTKICNYRTFVKFILMIVWFILVLGVISFIAKCLNIEIINNIFKFLANTRTIRAQFLMDSTSQYALLNQNGYFAFGLPRVMCFFEEPALYAKFIYIFTPLIYAFSFSKVDFCSNKNIDILIKRTFVPLAILNIILTMSPIYLIFWGILTSMYFIKPLINILKKHVLTIFILLLCMLFIIQFCNFNIDTSNSYLSRIFNVINNVHSFDDLVNIEPSLATRIAMYINLLIVFAKYPFTGIGLGNNGSIIINQLLNSPIPLTGEIQECLSLSFLTGKSVIAGGFIYTFLAQNGIFIFAIFVMFYYKLYSGINLLYKYRKNLNLFDKTLSIGLKWSLVGIFLLFFYTLNITYDFSFHIIIALSTIFIYKFVLIKRQTRRKHE